MEETGLFEIVVPAHWQHHVTEVGIHVFEDQSIEVGEEFQLWITPFENETSKKKLVKNLGHLKPVIMGEYDCRYFPKDKISKDGFVTKSWVTAIANDVIYFSFTFSGDSVSQPHAEYVAGKVDLVKRIFASFWLWAPEERDRRLTSYRFEMLLQGIGATGAILRRAVENHAFIEATCLLSNMIDCFLRLSIVLKLQIINGNDIIEREWIYQGMTDKKRSEKDIYKKALEVSILAREVYDDLFELYDHRNRVVHRFIISEITLVEVDNIMRDYFIIMKQCGQIMTGLEAEQLRLGVGMVITDEKDLGNKSAHLNFITGKIGNLDYLMNKDLTADE
ncbi:MAG: hypothetical protein JWN76_1364 [Chitinophagaceae bacterium]|nr:hypothetical protein [Chitinophagaceae bacterium]